MISSNVNHLKTRIEGTFQLLITWLHEHTDAFINENSLERALTICKGDQTVGISHNLLVLLN